MKGKTICNLACVLMWLFTATAVAQPPDEHDLKVDITGIKQQNGQVVILLFTSKDGFPDDTKKAEQVAKVKPDKPTHTFTKLKPGKYVVVVFHDVNDNGKVDKSPLGFPQEPIGISNHPKIGIGGPPSFDKAKTNVTKEVKVKINLVSLGR